MTRFGGGLLHSRDVKCLSPTVCRIGILHDQQSALLIWPARRGQPIIEWLWVVELLCPTACPLSELSSNKTSVSAPRGPARQPSATSTRPWLHGKSTVVLRCSRWRFVYCANQRTNHILRGACGRVALFFVVASFAPSRPISITSLPLVCVSPDIQVPLSKTFKPGAAAACTA